VEAVEKSGGRTVAEAVVKVVVEVAAGAWEKS
jgi:hypothetical protein